MWDLRTDRQQKTFTLTAAVIVTTAALSTLILFGPSFTWSVSGDKAMLIVTGVIAPVALAVVTTRRLPGLTKREKLVVDTALSTFVGLVWMAVIYALMVGR